jgi:alanine dehydrogenase
MSEVAGRMSIQEGAKYLERPQMGRGILLAGVPGVEPAHITILGGGVVGANAARIAAGFGADVSLLDINMDRLRYLDDIMPPNVMTLFSDRHTVREQLKRADLVIGSVLVPGARAPCLIESEDLRLMKPGSVIIDVAIDQGGCVASSRPTTHSSPFMSAVSTTARPICPRRRTHQHLRAVQRHASLQIASSLNLGIESGRRRSNLVAERSTSREADITNMAVPRSFGKPWNRRPTLSDGQRPVASLSKRFHHVQVGERRPLRLIDQTLLPVELGSRLPRRLSEAIRSLRAVLQPSAIAAAYGVRSGM